MRGIKFFILLILVFTSIVYSQFHIKPRIEVSLAYDDNFNKKIKIKQIVISGESENNENIIRIIKIEENKTHCIFYDIDPGKYLLGLEYTEDQTNMVHIGFSVIIEEYLNTETFEPSSEFKIMNEFSVLRNRNFKIDLFFTSMYENNSFTNKSIKRLGDYDFMKLICNIVNIENNKIQNLTASNDKNGQSFPSICQTEIGGESEEIIIDKKISCPGEECKDKFFDIKSIKVKVNHKVSEKPKGYKGLGEDYLDENNTRRVKIGSFGLSGEVAFKFGVSGAYGYCCPEPACRCFINIEDLELKVFVETLLWNKTESCDEFKNKHCDCLFKSIQYHERYHCNSFRTSLIEKVNKIDFCKTNFIRTCLFNPECNDYIVKKEAIIAAVKPIIDYIKSEDWATNDHSKLWGDPKDPHDGLEDKFYDDCVKNSKK